MSRAILRKLRDDLVAVQTAEPHHRRVGVAVAGHARPPTLEQVCRRCPSRTPCWIASLALARVESEELTK